MFCDNYISAADYTQTNIIGEALLVPPQLFEYPAVPAPSRKTYSNLLLFIAYKAANLKNHRSEFAELHLLFYSSPMNCAVLTGSGNTLNPT